MAHIDEYKHLGYRALLVFMLEGVLPSAGLLLISLFIAFIKPSFIKGLEQINPENINREAITTLFTSLHIILISLFFLISAVSIFIAWLHYSNYKYILDENGLKIERGVFHKEEVSIPYHQIQNVEIRRPLLYRFLGVSKIVIETAGQDNPQAQGEAEGTLSVIDKYQGQEIRETLLNRSREQIT